ncbi:hypothetical protein [Pseudescherichia sp.]|uniref:hypothetical protein n=1 Tax=Pseudescherichia sp. TaxID=2055881 RepID=UPI0028A0EA74|nr:hypothetical protein [Pseudescherichia sp.]
MQYFVGSVSVAPPGVSVPMRQRRAALRLPGLRGEAGAVFFRPGKRSATGRICADAATPGGTAFARPTG